MRSYTSVARWPNRTESRVADRQNGDAGETVAPWAGRVAGRNRTVGTPAGSNPLQLPAVGGFPGGTTVDLCPPVDRQDPGILPPDVLYPGISVQNRFQTVVENMIIEAVQTPLDRTTRRSRPVVFESSVHASSQLCNHPSVCYTRCNASLPAVLSPSI